MLQLHCVEAALITRTTACCRGLSSHRSWSHQRQLLPKQQLLQLLLPLLTTTAFTATTVCSTVCLLYSFSKVFQSHGGGALQLIFSKVSLVFLLRALRDILKEEGSDSLSNYVDASRHATRTWDEQGSCARYAGPTRRRSLPTARGSLDISRHHEASRGSCGPWAKSAPRAKMRLPFFCMLPMSLQAN